MQSSIGYFFPSCYRLYLTRICTLGAATFSVLENFRQDTRTTDLQSYFSYNW